MAREPGLMEEDEGGDAACWAHLFEDDAGEATMTTPLSEPALATIVRAMGDGVVVADPQGRIAFWNAGAERIFGWSAAEAEGKTLDLIIPERQRDAHWTGYRQVMATGRTKYGTDLLRVPAVHRNGERISIAFTVALLTGDDGRVESIAAIIRDETERWTEERDLRRRLRDLEAAAGS